MELRCSSKILFGRTDDGVIEVSCKSRWCGKRRGVVVIHRFNAVTGEFMETLKFSEPNPQEEESNGIANQGTSVRTA